MIRTPEAAAALVAQLEKEHRAIDENWELNEAAWARIERGASHALDWAALGYTMHAVYTSMEAYFLRIAKSYENDLSRESWHRELLERMQIEIPGVRPALLDRDAARLLDELRGFRHVFRVLYDDRFDTERLSLLQRRMPMIRQAFEVAHARFLPLIVESVE